MPRYRRLLEPGSVQHVISRFVDRRLRFDEVGARDAYLARVPAALDRSDWRALAFALMGSHVHWSMKAGERPSSAFVRPLHSGFAGWLNRRSHALGPVFADRHRTVAFHGATAAALIAYVHNNPVRAGLVRDPAESHWTSHRAYIGLDPAPPWLNVELGLELCGFAPTSTGRARFHELVCAHATEQRSAVLSGGDLDARRVAARTAAANPVELFAPRVRRVHGESRLETDVILPPHCPARRPWRGSPLEVIEFVALGAGLRSEDLRSRSRAREVTSARKLALLLWRDELSRANQEMANALGIGASAACGLLARARVADREQAARLACELRGQDVARTPEHE